jgi:hypothetical protein
MGSSQHDGDRRLQRWQGLVSEGWWTEQEDSGFHSQLVPLSSGYALAHKMLRSVNSAFCLFLGMGVTHSILPICLWFYMLAVISCNSHLQEDRWEDKPGGADNSSVHHTVINTSQESCTTVLLTALILGRREKEKKHCILKAVREISFLRNEFLLLGRASPAAFSGYPQVSSPSTGTGLLQARSLTAWLCEK